MKSRKRPRLSITSKSNEENNLQILGNAPLLSNYDEIRPLLDAVDKLRHLKVMKEGIELPTIVVVGDQSSGKSSVLESLAGINLPRGQGICTRVPLIMRLQHHSTPHPEFYLEFRGKTVKTDEAHISEAISSATNEIAGNGKGISNTPLTLIVKKEGLPDLTMVDLPGITRVPVHGQPPDIYEQVSKIIMEYITPKESIILNVLSATVDFPTCESIRMSQMVDETGERTLAVVTKADKAPEGLLEKVTVDDVDIGLGYICVRNRVGKETFEEAKTAETKLFETHPLLSQIDKCIVGIPVLAQKLVQIQAAIIAKCLPDIVRKINEKLMQNMSNLNGMPQTLSTMAHAMAALMQIIGSAKESLRKILLRGEFDDYPDESEMHCTARLVEMLNEYLKQLQLTSKEHQSSGHKFLMEEMKVIEETKSIGLPNFLSRSAFLTLLHRRVKEISVIPVEFTEKFWNYIENVVVRVLEFHSDGYPQLQYATRRAAHNLILKMKCRSVDRVMEIVEMEKLTDYTCDLGYMSTWHNLMTKEEKFNAAMKENTKFSCGEYGSVEVGHLKDYPALLVQQAFDMKMRMSAYWKIVLKRLVDSLALQLLFSVHGLVNKEMEMEIVNQMMESNNGGIEQMLEESPSVASKRQKLTKSINVLKDSKEVVAKIMDRITAHGD